MTWGSVATENFTDTKLASEQQRVADRERNRGMWIAEAREVLAYRQTRDGVWVLSGHEQTMGLPSALVIAARQACQVEASARAVLEKKHNEAMAYIQRHQLSAESAAVHLELTRAESWTAYHEAARDAERQCARLGEAVESIRELRTIVNAGPEQDARIDAWAKAEHDKVAQRVEGARAGLLRWGV